ncbi:lysine N(6)-hydroxylase/L-ornithine N(5)-oxygenase family protein [Streptomyces lavendulae]|uniref:lysine N(6)-hydroxylase/L-ornithine N(5)-oxygenase family protein n=1 Tax=Streptomyces TaxID=1883 RepID=UPI002474F82B|nr:MULTISPECIES: SidA/IucD/PvdA family monooxygenase [Streptomyces]MDH6542224.1 lysine N6-hydroxylase [Streptomyces sp. SPB4]GLV87131.1 L-lysine 6-monooxygenase [Streptomyces lavendulae subsp. lavendulae]GLW01028.1 L-lysine 6-monooxygenase [Streptomyces lavendulae subsp. lavendulae]GLX40614.1 L-lysine 6-monooxygenase [Streptomyces roseochromogenus]
MGHESFRPGITHFRCLGVGVGPANLSLASLLHSRPDVPNLFLDRKESFSWHDGQQIPGTTLQVSQFKDLVSLADPANPFSFLSYLHAKGRVYHFLNARFDDVPRLEFRNYLAWASRRNENIVFGEGVREVGFDDGLGAFTVRTDRRELTAENVVVGVGSRPWVPPQGEGQLGPTQFHVADYLNAARDVGGKRVVVIGGGQSGAEAFLDLISRSGWDLPRRVSWISRRPNYLPIDDSPFTNDYYMPSHAEYFYGLPRERRQSMNSRNILTSDGISESTLRDIYQTIYVHRFVEGNEDLVALHPGREVFDVSTGPFGGWEVCARHTGEPESVERFEADIVVWATGYRPAAMDFLAPLTARLEHEGEELRVDEDYAVRWDGPADRRIFVQNGVRGQRGLADPNLSLNAWRSRRIADRLCGVRGDEQLASFIEWSSKAPQDERWSA